VYESYREIDSNFTLDGWAEKWTAITKEDVSELAKKVTKVHTFFLTTKEGAS